MMFVLHPRWCLAAAFTVLAAAQGAAAQDWRTLESSRQHRSDAPAKVRVEYGAGSIELAPTGDAVLYRMKLRYDTERSAPIAIFDDVARSITLGMRSGGEYRWKSGHREGSTLVGALSNRVPLDLSLELGAVRADVQLGGLKITDLVLQTGASEVKIDVNAPNSEQLVTFDIDVGAAQVTVRRGGNLRAERIKVNVGAGSLDLDLDGAWEGDVSISANVAVGAFRLRTPSDVGIRVKARTFLADFKHTGFVKRGDAWYSAGYDAAVRRADVSVTAVLGGFEIIRP